MTYKVKLNPNGGSRFNVKVNTTGGILKTYTPLTVKNQVSEYQINSIEDIPDVAVANAVNGATLVYNSSTDIYEIDVLNASYLTGVIDGGEF